MMIKCNFLFVFKELRRGAIKSFHIVSYFFIQFNGKLDVGVQSINKYHSLGCKMCIPKSLRCKV